MKYITTSTLKKVNSTAKANSRAYIDEELIASLPSALRFPILRSLPQDANWLRLNIGIAATKEPAEAEYHSLFLDVKRNIYERLLEVKT